MAAANVYATGTFTIPMMKRLGYRPQFAGAVEAVASSGGQYMPPIMGAGAFVMSEITAIPYLDICVAAALPAIAYYASLAIRVHFIALKDNLKGMKEEDMMVPLPVIIKDSYLLIPLVGLVTMLVVGYSVFMAAMGAIVLSFVISFFKRENRHDPQKASGGTEVGRTEHGHDRPGLRRRRDGGGHRDPYGPGPGHRHGDHQLVRRLPAAGPDADHGHLA